ncbi:Ger(x)C family spore germination protein [Paenibacillus sp. S-38]|uniref:Ger(x)C family spore germination protein n=1 Tax=Paenibacillus sp. S-38 TaxID=3416710 RepID=UPI003CFABF20
MRRRLLLGCVLVLFLVSLTGCWNRRELNELTVVVALGIDKTKDGYAVSVQLVNAQEIAAKGGSGYATPVTVYQGKGATVFEALRRLTMKLNRRLYLSHIRVVVLGEELAREGIRDALDFLSRDHELRTDFYMLVAKSSRAEEVLTALAPLEKIPANKMFSALEVMKENWAGVVEVTLDELLADMLSEGIQPVATGIRLAGDPALAKSKSSVQKSKPEAVIEYEGMAVFRQDRLVGWLNEEESTGFNYAMRGLESTIVSLACPEGGGRVAIELRHVKSSIHARVQDGAPAIGIRVKTEGNIGDVECPMKVTDLRSVPPLEERLEKAIRASVQAAVTKSKTKLKTDIFGFGNAVHRDQPKLWKRIKGSWDQMVPAVPVEIHVDAKIRRVGTVTEPINPPKE